jgi:hypothetical protein
MFLAWMQATLPVAKNESALLAGQNCPKCGKGQKKQFAAEKIWLASASDMGAFAQGSGCGGTARQIEIDCGPLTVRI